MENTTTEYLSEFVYVCVCVCAHMFLYMCGFLHDNSKKKSI